MITIFMVLGIVLLAIPLTCILFVMFSKLKQRKRAETMKNATNTKTTVAKGPNGRTIFETTATKSFPTSTNSRKTSPPRSPILPFTQQEASKSSRRSSVKGAWKRLSRPFSAVPAGRYEEDEIELTQKTKPLPYQSKFQEQMKTNTNSPISPMTTPDKSRFGSSSSWNTIDHMTSDPVSPLSITNVRPSSSITGHVLQSYQTQRQQPRGVEQFQTIPLTPPNPSETSRKDSSTARKHRLDVGAARGFMAPQISINKQDGVDFDKQRGKVVGKPVDQYAAGLIKQNLVEHKTKVNRVQLAAPPKALARAGKGDSYVGWV